MSTTLVMIHGMYGGSWCWDGYRDLLERRGYRCLTPTLRHHEVEPDAPPHMDLGTTSLLDYAADLQAEIEGLEESPVLVGHSMGGLLAQILAARGLARAVVLLAPAPPAGVPALTPSVVRSFANTLSTWAFWKNPTRPTFAGTTWSVLNLVPERDRPAIFARFVPESGRAALEIGLPFLDRRRASVVDEAMVTCPLLVVAGGRDRVTPRSVVTRIARKYEQAELEVFDDNAHWVLGEPGWEAIAGLVADWLERRTAPAEPHTP